LNQPSAVQPGATIWLHAGTYRGNFTSRLAGTAASPITVRGAAGERAILDGVPTPSGHVLTINGAFSIFRDFEVTNSFATRVITSTGSNPTDARGEGVGMYGQGVKLVNLVIHDTGHTDPSSSTTAGTRRIAAMATASTRRTKPERSF
jgi:hypothetical protein